MAVSKQTGDADYAGLHNGKIDGFNHFMDFMIFNEAMKDENKEKRKDNRDWIDELEDLDAMDDD